MGFKMWDYKPADPERSAALRREMGISPLLADVLVARGFQNAAAANAFLWEGSFSDPFLLKDMDKAVERIRRALYNDEKIVVYGDYDADGVTATSLIFTYFDATGADISYYIPSREGEGYGLNKVALRKLKEQGFDLVITVDNGITAIAETEYANQIGLDIVITDHHSPKETLPPACAVIDPHRPDCPSPCKELAGVGVAFKLLCALEDGDAEGVLYQYGDLITIGTIGDVVPLVGENRAILKRGLEQMEQTDNPGIQALLQVGGVRELTSQSVAFGLVPRINAAGRLGDAQTAVELLCCEDEEQAAVLAQEVNEKNTRRKELEAEILEDIDRMAAQSPELFQGRIIVLSGHGWHHGVVGIVASRVMEKYEKPCFLVSIDGSEARASGRSFGDFSLFQLLCACDHLLVRYGGHRCAAGFTVKTEHLEELVDAMSAYAKEYFDEMPPYSVPVDVLTSPAGLEIASVKELSLLEPFGCENETPSVALENVKIDGIYPVSEGKHLRLRLKKDGDAIYAIWFRMAPQDFPYQKDDTVDVLLSVSINEYGGEERLNAIVRDMRPHISRQERYFKAKQAYEKYRRQEPLSPSFVKAMLPTREELGVVYRSLCSLRGFRFGGDLLCLRIGHPKINYCKLMVSLDILEELGFITQEAGEIRLVPRAPKRPMEQSQVYQALAVQLA